MENLNKIRLLVIDIETVPQYSTFSELCAENEQLASEWKKKCEGTYGNDFKGILEGDAEPYELLYSTKAALHPEFGKICCISYTFCSFDQEKKNYVTKTGHSCETDEKKILFDFSNVVNNFSEKPCSYLSGAYVKNFDLPFIVKRMWSHGISIPKMIAKNLDCKPWEMTIIDLADIWKCGSYSQTASLGAMCLTLGVPTPKDDVCGADVQNLYRSGNLDAISEYCDKDVEATLGALLQINSFDNLSKDEYVVYADYAKGKGFTNVRES
jgi:predicted PolB exonuclease-like 3'-5' exonuclease